MITEKIINEETKDIIKKPIKIEESNQVEKRTTSFTQNNAEHLKDIEKLVKEETKKEYV